MTLNIVQKHETYHESPFTFHVERVGVSTDGKEVYVIGCFIDDYGVCNGGFYADSDYETSLRQGLDECKRKARGKFGTMQAELQRLRDATDKLGAYIRGES